jgi:hypothetical protein
MEVEFLSNMRYSLLVSKAEWESWLVKLASIWAYCEQATLPTMSPLVIPSPSAHQFISPVPSPTHPLLTPSTIPSPPGLLAYSPGFPPPGPDGKNAYGKRLASDEDPTEAPAKRVYRPPPSLLSMPPKTNGDVSPTSRVVLEPLRLPMPQPQLKLDIKPSLHPVSTASAPYTPGAYTPHQMQSQQGFAPSLPRLPMMPGVRAMATVYPGATAAPTPQQVVAATTIAGHTPVYTTTAPAMMPTYTTATMDGSASGMPAGASLPSSGTLTSGTMTPGYTATTGHATPTKRMSPNSSLTSGYGASSPLTEGYPHLAGVHTPISHSPSIYLQQRSSPYKPVRSVKTLLYPPHSASLHDYHLPSNFAPTQMHYQPLGRRHEVHSGIVPDFRGVPFGGAVERGLPLTPIHGVNVPQSQQLPGIMRGGLYAPN